MSKQAKYALGERVLHQKQGYHAVIIDVDPKFQTSRGVPLLQSFDNDTANEPWYRVLIDESELVAYVRESLLAQDTAQWPIDNPKTKEFLTLHQNGKYKANIIIN